MSLFRGRAIALGALASGAAGAGGCGESVIDQAIAQACEVITVCNGYDESYRERCVSHARAVADDDGRPLDCAVAYARYLRCVYDVDCDTYRSSAAHSAHVLSNCYDLLREAFELCP